MTDTKIAGLYYPIPCTYEINPSDSSVCIIIHGFGSSKQSPTAQMMLSALRFAGVGVIAFDFPAHGESPVDGDFLRLPYCLADLSSVEQFALNIAKNAEICYFGSSFGAYITLLHLSSGNAVGSRAFLRSAAVSMPQLFKNRILARPVDFKRDGFILDEQYYRPLKLTQALADDFERSDVFELYKPGSANLHMIHGTLDEIASPDDALRFAKEKSADITLIAGGDHQLSITGAPEKVARIATQILCN